MSFTSTVCPATFAALNNAELLSEVHFKLSRNGNALTLKDRLLSMRDDRDLRKYLQKLYMFDDSIKYDISMYDPATSVRSSRHFSSGYALLMWAVECVLATSYVVSYPALQGLTSVVNETLDRYAYFNKDVKTAVKLSTGLHELGFIRAMHVYLSKNNKADEQAIKAAWYPIAKSGLELSQLQRSVERFNRNPLKGVKVKGIAYRTLPHSNRRETDLEACEVYTEQVVNAFHELTGKLSISGREFGLKFSVDVLNANNKVCVYRTEAGHALLGLMKTVHRILEKFWNKSDRKTSQDIYKQFFGSFWYVNKKWLPQSPNKINQLLNCSTAWRDILHEYFVLSSRPVGVEANPATRKEHAVPEVPKDNPKRSYPSHSPKVHESNEASLATSKRSELPFENKVQTSQARYELKKKSFQALEDITDPAMVKFFRDLLNAYFGD